MEKRPCVLAIDFDGTIVEEAYPGIGKIKFEADKYINMLYDEGFIIIINTCRTGIFEGNAETFLNHKGIKYHYINNNLPSSIEYFKKDSRKISADFYIDDKCLMGLPETWGGIYCLVRRKYYNKNI